MAMQPANEEECQHGAQGPALTDSGEETGEYECKLGGKRFPMPETPTYDEL